MSLMSVSTQIRGPEFHPCQRLQLPTVVDLTYDFQAYQTLQTSHVISKLHVLTDDIDRLRPDKIVFGGAREATAVNGIIGVALRPLAIGSGFHVVILITILTCCDDACTVWMWTTS